MEARTVFKSTAKDPVSAKVFICLGLLLLVFIIYGQTGKFPFIDFDDSEYVYENGIVRQGLSSAGVVWAFSTFWSANWHPVTWLSHMMDVQMFGLDPGWHHLSNVLLHGLNTVVLFILLNSMTDAFWRSALVAALFAVHPQHVESVAWIAERKDVLSVFFWLLTMGAYLNFVRWQGAWRYGLILLTYSLGLMSKPMLVTLPLVLLLLDYWPLQRLGSEADVFSESGARGRISALIREKIPLILLALASCIITYAAQHSWQATASLNEIPLKQRIANALLSTILYLAKTVYPVSLAVFYPHPSSIGESVSVSAAMVAAVALVFLVTLTLAQWKVRPWITVGGLWFLITLAPVIGLVQIGSQAMADRYTYLPHIGLFIALAWSIPVAVGEASAAKFVVGGLCTSVLVALSATTWIQVGYWRDGVRLYTHAITVTDRNWLAWNNLGMQYLNAGKFEVALASFRKAVEIKVDYADAWYNAGVAQQRLGINIEAARSYEEALKLEPRNADGWTNLGLARQAIGNYAFAIQAYQQALQLRPDDSLAIQNLFLLSAAQNDLATLADVSERLRLLDPQKWHELMSRIR